MLSFSGHLRILHCSRSSSHPQNADTAEGAASGTSRRKQQRPGKNSGFVRLQRWFGGAARPPLASLHPGSGVSSTGRTFRSRSKDFLKGSLCVGAVQSALNSSTRGRLYPIEHHCYLKHGDRIHLVCSASQEEFCFRFDEDRLLVGAILRLRPERIEGNRKSRNRPAGQPEPGFTYTLRIVKSSLCSSLRPLGICTTYAILRSTDAVLHMVQTHTLRAHIAACHVKCTPRVDAVPSRRARSS